MLIIVLLTFWYSMIQYRKCELRWIFFVYMFFKTNYIWILLWCVTFHVQVEIGLYVMSPALESISRPSMRLWFYAAFIQIEFGSRVRSYVHLVLLEEKIALYLEPVAPWKSRVYKYAIRFQVINLKHLCETLKNVKFLLDIQTKCGNIANEILNAAIDAEWTFKCKTS